MKRNLFYLLTAIFTLSLCLQGCSKDNDPDTGGEKPQPGAPVITITTQPSSVSVTAGSITGSLSVAASVTPNAALTYQWYSNTSNSKSGGSAVSGATSASFAIPTTLTAGSYYYFCEVKSSGATSVHSDVAAVTVTAPNLPAIEVKVIGNISASNFVEGTTGSVEFNRFPASVDEWKQVREKIGETMMGAFVLQVMASEMYRRNNTIGEECMRLAIISASQNSYINLVKNMKHPYQFAAHLKGASPTNGYNPTKPYTIEFVVTRTSNKQYSNDYQADTYRFFAISNGHDLTERTFSVLKTAKPGEPGEGGKYYIVISSSTLYNECKEKSFSQEFKGLD